MSLQEQIQKSGLSFAEFYATPAGKQAVTADSQSHIWKMQIKGAPFVPEVIKMIKRHKEILAEREYKSSDAGTSGDDYPDDSAENVGDGDDPADRPSEHGGGKASTRFRNAMRKAGVNGLQAVDHAWRSLSDDEQRKFRD